MWPAVTQKMSPSKWALRDPLLKIILPAREMNPGCVAGGGFTLVCVCTGREGSERGNIPWVNKWLLYLHSRMMFQHKMWFQFEALACVTFDNGHLQSELPVLVLFSRLYGSVILNSECIFVFVREFSCMVLILCEIFEESVFVTWFDLFEHFGSD